MPSAAGLPRRSRLRLRVAGGSSRCVPCVTTARRCGASAAIYTARTATSIMRTRARGCSRSTRRWARARPAVVSGGSSASISGWRFLTSRRRSPKVRSNPGRPRVIVNARTTSQRWRRSTTLRWTSRFVTSRPSTATGCWKATTHGRAGHRRGHASGTEYGASSSGWKPRPTRCTSGCCCHVIAATPYARRVTARG